MTYLLDTNAAIAIINDRPQSARKHFLHHRNESHPIAISAIVVFELWYGVAKSERWEQSATAVRGFLQSPIDILNFDSEDAQAAAELRNTLNRAGTPIGPYDLLIAAQALRRNVTLVTANKREFSRVEALEWEDWSKS